jgi:hypothetical protein
MTRFRQQNRNVAVNAGSAFLLYGRFRPRPLAPFLTIFAVAAVSAAAIAGAVQAQTLINPNATPHAPAPAARQSKQMRSCSMYGPGFVQVPGSDLCVKIGGFVQGEVTGR